MNEWTSVGWKFAQARTQAKLAQIRHKSGILKVLQINMSGICFQFIPQLSLLVKIDTSFYNDETLLYTIMGFTQLNKTLCTISHTNT